MKKTIERNQNTKKTNEQHIMRKKIFLSIIVLGMIVLLDGLRTVNAGISYNGESYNGTSYNGDGWNGQGFNGDGWNGQGFNGDGWNGQGFNGDGYNGTGLNDKKYNRNTRDVVHTIIKPNQRRASIRDRGLSLNGIILYDNQSK